LLLQFRDFHGYIAKDFFILALKLSRTGIKMPYNVINWPGSQTEDHAKEITAPHDGSIIHLFSN